MKINLLKFYKRKDGFVEVFKQMYKNQGERLQVLVVPEKFGVSAERAMFDCLKCGSSFFMDVTTFDRLADIYVIDKKIQYLSKSAGVMLVQKITQDIADELNVLSKSCLYNGFCENVFNTIMLLKSSTVSPNMLSGAVENLMDVSKLKLLDIQKIYQLYEDTIKDRFIDSANKMDILSRELEYDDAISNVDFYVYSPKLTKQILNVCDKLIKKSHSVTFMVDCYSNNSIVYDENINNLYGLIKSNGGKYDENTIQRFDSLSVQIKDVSTKNKYKNNNIQFYSQKNINDEVTSVCVDINKKGCRYKDCAVMVCDLPKYQSSLQKIFDEFEIPYFIDTEQTLLDLKPTKVLLQLINIIFEFKVDKVLSIVKSKIFNYDQQNIYNFELYIKRWGINERNFFSENKPEDDLFEDFKKIYDDFSAIYKNFKTDMQKCKTYGEFITVLKEFLTKYDFENKILCECENLLKINELQKSKLYEQITAKLMALFDQLESILGLNQTTVKDFYNVLKAGLGSVMIKTPPLTVDCVYIGNASNCMLYDYENLYCIGCNEGSFPVYNQDCGLILDAELDKMRTLAQIDPTIREVNMESLCNIINNLCCCSKLYLSYPISVFFVEQRPATLLLNLKKIFVNNENKEVAFLNYQAPNLLESANDLAIDIKTKTRAEMFLRKINNAKDYKTKQQILRLNGLAKKLNLNLDNEEILPKIPRKLTKSSVSQLQVYFDCPYKNFVKYGLRLKENPDNTLKPIDVGNFMHKVAEMFGLYLIKNKISYVEDENIFDKICLNALKTFEYDSDGKKGKIIDARQKIIINNLVYSAKSMLKAINEQNKLSEFKIQSVEKVINLKVSNGIFDTEINGKVDRVDTFENYVRIIDYKTGNENFNETDLISGRRIQLFVYLGALQKLEKLCPIGAYYFKIKDEITSAYEDKNYLKTYCLNGVTLDDEKIVLAQDTSLNENHPNSDIIPINCSFKDGFKIDKRRMGAYSSEKMQWFIDYAIEIFKQGTREIALGNIEKSPYLDACQFCEFKGVLCLGNKNCRQVKILKEEKTKTKK